MQWERRFERKPSFVARAWKALAWRKRSLIPSKSHLAEGNKHLANYMGTVVDKGNLDAAKNYIKNNLSLDVVTNLNYTVKDAQGNDVGRRVELTRKEAETIISQLYKIVDNDAALKKWLGWDKSKEK